MIIFQSHQTVMLHTCYFWFWSGSSELRPRVEDEGGDGKEDVWEAVDEIEGYVRVKRSD